MRLNFLYLKTVPFLHLFHYLKMVENINKKKRCKDRTCLFQLDFMINYNKNETKTENCITWI